MTPLSPLLTFAPAWVRFGMWLPRPRLAREFRGYRDTLAAAEHFFLPLVEAVDNIYANPTLQEFWRKGSLVANSKHPHPYQWNIPTEYQDTARCFMPDTSLDPPWPYDLFTQLPVYALALVKGARLRSDSGCSTHTLPRVIASPSSSPFQITNKSKWMCQ